MKNAMTAPMIAIRMMIQRRLPLPSPLDSVGAALGAGVGEGDGEADGEGDATTTGVTTTWIAGLRIAVRDDRDAGGVPPQLTVVTDLGGHDVVLGRLDVGDRVRHRECDRQTVNDVLGIDAERIAGGRIDQDRHRVRRRRQLDPDAGDLAGHGTLQEVGPVGQGDVDVLRVALGQDRDAVRR